MEVSISFEHLELGQLVLHRVGNKYEEEGTRAAKAPFDLQDPELKEVLMHYFLDSFKLEEVFRFDHESSLEMNEVYTYCQYIFQNPELLYDQSLHILQHLYEQSNHPNIKGGELYVAYFKDCLVEDELVDAIGIFKAENKNTYLKLKLDEEGRFYIDYEEGTNIAKLDKGCLVLNSYDNDGYRVVTVDLKSAAAKYWRDTFLQVTQIQDNNFHTRAYMDLCKDFVKEVYAEAEGKDEQVSFLNKSLEYFNTHEQFDYNEFKEQVLPDEQKAQQFEQYRDDYQVKKGIEEEEAFFISQPTVKKMKRRFKNTIQLDTQIEIKIHSSEAQSQAFIEKGVDEERGMKYYKVYFNEEK